MRVFLYNLIKDTNLFEFKSIKKKINNFPIIGTATTTNIDNYFLAILIKKFKPNLLLEIGTYVGKSTYSMCVACNSNGLDYSIDSVDDPEMMPENKIVLQKDYFKNYKQVKFHLGHSSKVLPSLNRKYDFIFIDGNLDNITTKELIRITHKNTLIVLHDFVPPFDKGIYNLSLLANYMSFYYTAPSTKFKNLSLNTWINCNGGATSYDTLDFSRLNRCCALIVFNEKFIQNTKASFDKSETISIKSIFTKYLYLILKIIKYFLNNKKNFFILKIINIILIFDCENKKIIRSEIIGKEIKFKRIYS